MHNAIGGKRLQSLAVSDKLSNFLSCALLFTPNLCDVFSDTTAGELFLWTCASIQPLWRCARRISYDNLATAVKLALDKG